MLFDIFQPIRVGHIVPHLPEKGYTYRADLVKDESKTVRLKASCGAQKESEFVKYSVENLHFYSKKDELMFVG